MNVCSLNIQDCVSLLCASFQSIHENDVLPLPTKKILL